MPRSSLNRQVENRDSPEWLETSRAPKNSIRGSAQTGEAPSAGAKSALKAGPGTDEPCPNADCIGTVKILLQNGEHCSVTGTYGDGQTISAGEETDVPLGTKVTIETECGDRFVAWHAPGTMADGSGEPSETFTVTQAQTGAKAIKALERTEATVTILRNGTVISTQTALVGEEVPIAPGGFKVGSNHDPGRTIASKATVLAGIGDSTIELEGALTLSSQRLVHTIESEGGGRVILAEGGDPDAAAFLNTAVSFRASQPVAPWRRVVFQAIPDVGYFPQYPLESLVIFGNMYRFLHDSYSPVGETIAFPKMYELTLIALPEGGGNPECAGYIKAHEAKKYYLPGEEVQLTAVGQPRFVFAGWTGLVPAYDGTFGDEQDPSTWLPIEWLYSEQVTILVEGSETVIARFEECEPPTTMPSGEECACCLHSGSISSGGLFGDVFLPDGFGYYHFTGTDSPGTDAWACLNWVHKKLAAIGRAWGSNPPFGVGDISKEGGGSFPPHAEHQNGLNVDVRYVRSDGETGEDARFKFGDDPLSLYDDEKTQALVNLFLSHGATKILAYSGAGLTGVEPKSDHKDHFHVYFPDPDGTNN